MSGDDDFDDPYEEKSDKWLVNAKGDPAYIQRREMEMMRRLKSSIEALDRSTSALSVRIFWLTVVGVVLTAAQVALTIFELLKR